VEDAGRTFGCFEHRLTAEIQKPQKPLLSFEMVKFDEGRLDPERHPLVIWADGRFGSDAAKFASGVLRYGPWKVTAVVDRNSAGRTIGEMIGVAHSAPIVADFAESLDLLPRPRALLLGTAPIGGALSRESEVVIREAIAHGLHIINGSHAFLAAREDLRALASERGVHLWDVRAVPYEQSVSRQLPRPGPVKVITTVGSDCSIGKMSTALEIQRALIRRGKRAQFLATGQTGIVISGFGVPLDRTIADFTAGAIERAILELIETDNPDWIIVEGQGSLFHPAYSGVSLALLHGSAPDAMIFCHKADRTVIADYERVKLPPIIEMIHLYETMARYTKPARVVAIGLNTFDLPEAAALELIRATELDAGLPATDAVRCGADALAEALLKDFAENCTC
jgi:uncharacterized NAD-dependent epimerase/dehydratase family protein